MFLIPYLHLCCVLVFVHLCVYTLLKAPQSNINRSFAILTLCISIWNIVFIFPENSISLNTLNFFVKFSGIGWILLPSAILFFSFFLCNEKTFYKNKYFVAYNIGISLIIIIAHCIVPLVNSRYEAYGHAYTWKSNVFVYAYFLHFTMCSLITFYVFYNYLMRSETIEYERKIAKNVFFALFFPIVIGAIFDILFPFLQVNFPPLASVYSLFFVVVIIYAIIEWQFLNITPAIAAKDIIANIGEHLILLNRDNHIITANRMAINTLGYSADFLKNKSIYNILITNEDINNRTNPNKSDSLFLKASGEKIPIIFSCKPILRRKKIVGYVFLAKNIIEIKKTEEKLTKALKKAEESERLKSAFIANLSHEIRTPINGILGFTNLLKKNKLENDSKKQYLYNIEHSSKRLVNLIDNIITISKIDANLEELNPIEMNVNNEIIKLFNEHKEEAEKKELTLSCFLELSDQEASIYVDKYKVNIIISNLITNAIKFTSNGTIEVGYKKEKHSFLFFVKDTGIGIDKNIEKIIFNRFRQGSESLSRNYEGTGLGLSISKAYAKLLGGKIWFENNPKKGACFYFKLPYKAMKTKATKIVNTNTKLINKKNNFKVLIAEDDKISALLLSTIVKKFTSNIKIANNGREAVDFCKKTNDYDLIFMDIKMPVLNGIDAIKEIRRFNKDIMIVVQSSYTNTSQIIEAINAGALEYVTKPLMQNEINTIILKYFDFNP